MPSRHRARREIRDAQLRSLLARFAPLKPGSEASGVVAVSDEGESAPEGAVADTFWGRVPSGLDPSDGELDAGRSARKRQQLGSMVAYVLPLMLPGDVCVDFGAGSGHLGLLVAWLRPDCHVVLVERKEYSAIYGLRRIAEMQITNCEFFCGGIEEFGELPSRKEADSSPTAPARFGGRVDVGVAMHACGLLTDLSVDLCVQRGAKFALCPCCYGQVGASVARPRSSLFQRHFGLEEFRDLASAADFTVRAGEWDFTATQSFATAKQCMTVVDCDRLESVAEALCSRPGGAAWLVMLGTLRPWSCTPKNNVILCGPAELLNKDGQGFRMAALAESLPAGRPARVPAVKTAEPQAKPAVLTRAPAVVAVGGRPSSAKRVTEWYPTIGQRVWAEADDGSGEWPGIVVGCDGEQWRVASEEEKVPAASADDGSCWWVRFETQARRQDRDLVDTSEALEKRLGGIQIEALPWEQPAEAPQRPSAWMHWQRLRPRRTLDSAGEGSSGESNRWLTLEPSEGGMVRKLELAGLLRAGAPGAGQEIQSGELGLAVESGGPLGAMRYATGSSAQAETAGVAAGHGQPGRRWVGLGGSQVPEALAPIFTQLLAELQRPPVLPTLRRNLETLTFFLGGSGLVLIFGFRDRGRGRAQRSAAVAPPQTAATLRVLRTLEERLSAAYASSGSSTRGVRVGLLVGEKDGPALFAKH